MLTHGGSSIEVTEAEWVTANESVCYSFGAIPSAFILRYRWLRSRPSSSAARVTLPLASSSFLQNVVALGGFAHFLQAAEAVHGTVEDGAAGAV